ncbi:DUF4129 domain-containing protein [Methanothermococcus sp. SCGC AD-155-E23]|nr:DUF4129 domain-containing protein [Methanothermococcus sp. SCGC AD-155-E23]
MRKVIILIFLLLLPNTLGAQFGEDELIHHYFQHLIDKGHESLQNLTYNRKGVLISAEVFNVTEDLKRRGIDHKLLEVSPPFKTFLTSLNNIVLNYNRMIEHRNIKNPQDFSIFKVSLENVSENIITLRECLDEIEEIRLRDREGKVLKFNTTEIREDLERILKNIEKYSEKLKRIEPEKGFSLYVDRDTIYLNSKVRVYGYINYPVKYIILLHNNKSYVVEVRDNNFSKDIYIRTPGYHTFYGVSPFGPSNKVTIKCLKIPTYIEVYPKGNLTAHLEEEIYLDVYLYDYYGNPLENKTIYIKYPEGEYSYKTPLKLRVKLDDRYIGYVNRTLPLEVVFKGDSNYSPSKERMYIKVLRIPTYITAHYCNNSLLGNLYDFRGKPLDSKRVYLIVGNNTYSTTTENGSFRFSISKFKEGYVVFRGDRKYAPSSKDLRYEGILVRGWSSGGNLPLLLLTFILLLAAVKIYWDRYRSGEKGEGGDAGGSPKISIPPLFSKLVERRMFREAVILAYQLFIKPLNIKKSWTPREICRRFRNVPGIKTITEIFERTYYGDIPPTESDVKECERFLRKR